MINLKPLFCCLLLAVPALVCAEDDCSTKPDADDRQHSLALTYKIAAVFAILLAGAIGLGIPLLGKFIPALSPDKNVFFLIKAFAAGVILATGCVHVLPDASESLTSPCLNENPWQKFPMTGLILMLSMIGTLVVDTFASSYFSKPHLNKAQPESGDHENLHLHTHATHGHAHGSASLAGESGPSAELIRHKIISQVLEVGIIVHSVIIGIALGASQSLETIKPLVAALCFHQFFEGMGLGSCISRAKFKSVSVVIMMAFFSLTTPVGIIIGLGITNTYNENSSTALIVEGILNATSAGILVYMALVDLLSADFLNPKVQSNGMLLLGVNVSLLLGAGLMSLLAIWA